jgi:hypothetical protein
MSIAYFGILGLTARKLYYITTGEGTYKNRENLCCQIIFGKKCDPKNAPIRHRNYLFNTHSKRLKQRGRLRFRPWGS